MRTKLLWALALVVRGAASIILPMLWLSPAACVLLAIGARPKTPPTAEPDEIVAK